MAVNDENLGRDELPDAVQRKVTEIVNGIMAAGQWGTVDGSAVVPQENNMWELRIRFNNRTTRRVRIGGNGGVTSDTIVPTAVLR
jgi:hypothetical protein